MILDDYNKKMTLFYSKNSKEIMKICSGEQNMDYFSSLKSDYEMIMDFVVVDKDEYIINNKNMFIINNENKPELKQEFKNKFKNYL